MSQEQTTSDKARERSEDLKGQRKDELFRSLTDTISAVGDGEVRLAAATRVLAEAVVYQATTERGVLVLDDLRVLAEHIPSHVDYYIAQGVMAHIALDKDKVTVRDRSAGFVEALLHALGAVEKD